MKYTQTGFNDNQIEFAATWWAGKLLGRDLTTGQQSANPLVESLREPEGKALAAMAVAMMPSQATMDETKIPVFIEALKKAVIQSIEAGLSSSPKGYGLQQSRGGGKYISLTSGYSESPELETACKAVNVNSRMLSRHGHNESLILQDDGQIYHRNVGRGLGKGHMNYPNCPTPEYKIVDPATIGAEAPSSEIVYGKVLAVKVPKDTEIPAGMNLSYDIVGFDAAKKPTHFPCDVYYLVREQEVSNFDALAKNPQDVLDQSKVAVSSIKVCKQGYVDRHKGGELTDMVAAGFEPTGEMPGQKLVATANPNIFQNTTLCQQYSVTAKLQFGSGFDNCCLNQGDTVLKCSKDAGSRQNTGLTSIAEGLYKFQAPEGAEIRANGDSQTSLSPTALAQARAANRQIGK